MEKNGGLKKRAEMLKGPAILVLLISYLVAFIVPLPGGVIDFILVISLSVAATIYLRSLTMGDWSELKTFPTILLLVTLFRIALNISTTRRILEDGEAGKVIEMFGNFVVGSNIIIGVVMFIILIIVQFIIANGTSRTAEVAARFTLDSLPVNFLSIDSELNQQLITQEEAKQRRKELEMKKDFFGHMDGAGRFVKGDVWIGVALIIVNIAAGLTMGVLKHGMTFTDALQRYTLLTVGDGIVNQLASFTVAVASGIVITRVYDGTKEDVGKGMLRELTFNPIVLNVVAVIIFMLGIITKVFIPFTIVALALIGLSYVKRKEIEKKKKEEENIARLKAEEEEMEQQEQPQEFGLVGQVEPILLEIGMALIKLATSEKDGQTIVDKISVMRKMIGEELGVNIPSIRIMDNMAIKPFNKYQIKIKNQLVAEGELQLNHVLAIKGPMVLEEMEGQFTKDPVYGEDAIWILEEEKEKAVSLGYIVQDALGIISLHVEEMVRKYLHELLRRQDVSNLLQKVQMHDEVLIKEIEKKNIDLGIIQGVLKNLLRERVPITDLPTILEGVIDASQYFPNQIDMITSIVRERISNYICQNMKSEDGKIYVMLLSPELERMRTVMRHDGYKLALNLIEIRALLEAIERQAYRAKMADIEPVIFTHRPDLRFALSRELQKSDVDVQVVVRNEISSNVMLEQIAVIDVPEIKISDDEE